MLAQSMNFLYVGLLLVVYCSQSVIFAVTLSPAHNRVHRVLLDSYTVTLTLRSSTTLEPLKFFVQDDTQVAINASFFTPSSRPVGTIKTPYLGLYVSDKIRGVVGWRNTTKGVQWYFDRLSKDKRGNIISAYYTYPWWEQAEYIIEGAPLLVNEGRKMAMDVEALNSNFVHRRYARTGLCVMPQGDVVLLLVEGADTKLFSFGLNDGMNLAELADYMQKSGCWFGINLDGGYSSSMYSDGSWYYGLHRFIPPFPPRRIHNALVFTKR